MVFCITIMLLGVIGNIMVPIVILKTKDMRNSTNIFLTNLSIADLLVLLVCTPTVLVEVNTRPEIWVLGQEMCKVVPFVELTVAHASVLTILAISFERYYAICEPLKAGYVCTKTRALLICVIAWAVAALFTSPILLMAEYKFEEYIDGSRVTVCLTQASSFWSMAFFLMTISLFFLLPLVVLVILYAVIARSLISKDGAMLKIRPTKPELSFKARKQVVLMLGAVVLSFFLCLLPFRVLTLWIISSSDEMFKNVGVEKYYNILYFSRIMLYLNSAINPVLYNLMSSKFRKGFLKLCCLTFKNSLRVRSRTATLNTTTTSSSFLSRSFNRRASDKMTSSLDDRLDEIRYKIDTKICQQAELESECELDLLKNTSAVQVPSRSDNFRKIAIRNSIRTRSTFSSAESLSSDELGITPEAQTFHYKIRCKGQISFDDELVAGFKKREKVVFQRSLDDREIGFHPSILASTPNRNFSILD